VDYGCLPYIPGHEYALGSDHYVVAYAIDDGRRPPARPAGFPHVSLPLTELATAWRAERIGYRRGAFPLLGGTPAHSQTERRTNCTRRPYLTSAGHSGAGAGRGGSSVRTRSVGWRSAPDPARCRTATRAS